MSDISSTWSSIAAKAPNALANNSAFLALSAPTQAQAVAQVTALTRQMNAVIRILLGMLDTTDGT